MDAEKFIQDLIDGPLGDLIRQRFVEAVIADLEDDPSSTMSEEEKAWSADVADWLRQNYL